MSSGAGRNTRQSPTIEHAIVAFFFPEHLVSDSRATSTRQDKASINKSGMMG
jgi:hypothetical protein